VKTEERSVEVNVGTLLQQNFYFDIYNASMRRVGDMILGVKPFPR
jgi:hypothetical protein